MRLTSLKTFTKVTPVSCGNGCVEKGTIWLLGGYFMALQEFTDQFLCEQATVKVRAATVKANLVLCSQPEDLGQNEGTTTLRNWFDS